MSIEEFKVAIIRQFNSPASALRYLMFPETPSETHVKFLTKQAFVANDFSLIVHVASVFDERGNIRFEILFEDMEDSNTPSFVHLKDITNVPMFLRRKGVREEHMCVFMKKLLLGVKSILVYHDSGTIRKRDVLSRVLSFDLSTMKFTDDSEMVNDTLATWSAMREEEDFYVDYSYDENAENELMDCLKRCGLSRDKIFAITNAFTGIEPFSDVSTLVQMVKALVKVAND